MTIELVTFENLKTFLDLNDPLSTDYPDLMLIRDNVTAAFENYCHRLFEPIERVKSHFYQVETSNMQLAAYPISAAAVTVDIGDGGGAVPLVEDTDFFNLESSIEFPSPYTATRIVTTYTGGLAVVPPDLTRAALRQTVYEYENKNNIGIETVSTPAGTTTKSEVGLLKDVKKILDKYKTPRTNY